MTEPGTQAPRSARYFVDNPGATVFAALDVELPAGRVEVVEGRNFRDRVTVTITERDPAGRPTDPRTTTVGIAEGLLVVHTPGMDSPDTPPLDVQVTVPSRMSGQIRTNSADISVARLKDVTAATESGTITLNRADGNVRVLGGTAPLEIGPVAGELDVTSVGPIEVESVSGHARIATQGEAKLGFPSQDWGYDVTSETSVVVNGHRVTATAGQPAQLSDSGAKTLDDGDRILAEHHELLESFAVERTVPASALGPVPIDVDGDIRRLRVTGQAGVEDYTVRIVPGSTTSEAKDEALGLLAEIAMAPDGSRLVIPGLQEGSPTAPPDLIEIVGPVGLDVVSTTSDAVVRLGGMVGSVDVTTGGSVHLHDSTGDVRVRAGGDVTAGQVGGGLDVVSGGMVSARKVAGTTIVEADHGATVDEVIGEHAYDVRSSRDIGQVRVGAQVATPDENDVVRLTGTGPVSSDREPARLPSRRTLAHAVGGPDLSGDHKADLARRSETDKRSVGGHDPRRKDKSSSHDRRR